MKRTFIILLFIFATYCEDQGLNENDIIKESQTCGALKFSQESCVETRNCVFMDWHIESLKSTISYCFSYNEIMKHFIKIPERYLKDNGILNYNTITKSNFCDIIDETDSFLGVKSTIEYCKASTL